jgi:hypothetical protein
MKLNDTDLHRPYTDVLAERPNDKFTVEIDFDKASEAWRDNKFIISCRNYVYICPLVKDNKKCGRQPFNGRHYCLVHNYLNPPLRKTKIV